MNVVDESLSLFFQTYQKSLRFNELSSFSTGGGPEGIVALGPAVKYPADIGVPAKLMTIH